MESRIRDTALKCIMFQSKCVCLCVVCLVNKVDIWAHGDSHGGLQHTIDYTLLIDVLYNTRHEQPIQVVTTVNMGTWII